VVPLPVEAGDDEDVEQLPEHALLRVERMDGLRVDRISLKRLAADDEGGQPA
jgi:hypothetical protein